MPFYLFFIQFTKIIINTIISVNKTIYFYLNKLGIISLFFFTIKFIIFPTIIVTALYIAVFNLGGFPTFLKSIADCLFFFDLLNTNLSFLCFEKDLSGFLNLFQNIWQSIDLVLAFCAILITLFLRFCSFDFSQPIQDFSKYKFLFLFFLLVSICIPLETILWFFDDWNKNVVIPYSKLPGQSVYSAYIIRVKLHLFLQLMNVFCLLFCKSSFYTRFFIALMGLLFSSSLTNLTNMTYSMVVLWERYSDYQFSPLKEIINNIFTSCMENKKTICTPVLMPCKKEYIALHVAIEEAEQERKKAGYLLKEDSPAHHGNSAAEYSKEHKRAKAYTDCMRSYDGSIKSLFGYWSNSDTTEFRKQEDSLKKDFQLKDSILSKSKKD